MKEKTSILQTRVTSKEKDLIKEASKLLGFGHSTFARMCALERARKIIIENKQFEVPASPPKDNPTTSGINEHEIS